MAEKLEGYPWSSHNGYVSGSSKWGWLYKEPIYACFSPDLRTREREYIQFMVQEDTEEIERIYSQKKLPAVLGSDTFIKIVRQRYSCEKMDNEVPESKLLVPSAQSIIDAVCSEHGIDEEVLLQSRRGTSNEQRNLAVYLVRPLRGEKLKSLAKLFHINSYSAVSSILCRMEERIKEEKVLEKKAIQLKELIKKSQEQI